ncbi:sigma-E factor negative regulatory protein [Polaromonas jejuensis]
MKPSMQTPELISALADGQLGREDFVAALQVCQHDESAVASWNTYHLIGDVLRSPGRAPVPLAAGADLAFVSQLSQRLALEPVGRAELSSVAPDSAPDTEVVPGGDLIHHRGPAANDGSFRWKLLAGLASLAAVFAIAWNASGLLAPAAAPQLAQAPGVQQVVVASPQGPMVRDARLEELLAAHQQLGGTSALQVPSGFLRNAAFEAPQSVGR